MKTEGVSTPLLVLNVMVESLREFHMKQKLLVSFSIASYYSHSYSLQSGAEETPSVIISLVLEN